MKIFVAGASGRVGRLVVDRALAAGHQVTAFVRSPAKLQPRSGLTIAVGEIAEDARAVSAALAGHDAVVSTLGNPLWLKAQPGPAIVTASFANLVTGMQAHGIERFVTMLAWGTGASRRPAGRLVQLIAATLIRRDFRDFTRAEALLVHSGLDWTLAYFGALTDAPPSAAYTVTRALRTPARLAIARADVADFLVDAAVSGKHSEQHVVLGGA